MAINLYRLGITQWWVEVDTVLEIITNKYNRPTVIADIEAINATLLLPQYPVPSEVDTFVAWVNGRIAATTWTAEVKAKAVALMQAMYQAYTGNDPLYVEAAQLIAKRDALVAILERLV